MSLAETRAGEAKAGPGAEGMAAPLFLPVDQFRGWGGS